jgi:hypothetical protein
MLNYTKVLKLCSAFYFLTKVAADFVEEIGNYSAKIRNAKQYIAEDKELPAGKKQLATKKLDEIEKIFIDLEKKQTPTLKSKLDGLLSDAIITEISILNYKFDDTIGELKNEADSFAADETEATGPDVRFVANGALGVELQDSSGGVNIIHIYRNSPAEKAGLMIGDLIVRVDNVPVKTSIDIGNLISKSADDIIEIKFKRANIEKSVIISFEADTDTPSLWEGQIGQDTQTDVPEEKILSSDYFNEVDIAPDLDLEKAPEELGEDEQSEPETSEYIEQLGYGTQAERPQGKLVGRKREGSWLAYRQWMASEEKSKYQILDDEFVGVTGNDLRSSGIQYGDLIIPSEAEVGEILQWKPEIQKKFLKNWSDSLNEKENMIRKSFGFPPIASPTWEEIAAYRKEMRIRLSRDPEGAKKTSERLKGALSEEEIKNLDSSKRQYNRVRYLIEKDKWPEILRKKRESDLQKKQERRQNEEFWAQEKIEQAKRMQERRQNEALWAQEKIEQAKRMQERRQREDIKQQEAAKRTKRREELKKIRLQQIKENAASLLGLSIDAPVDEILRAKRKLMLQREFGLHAPSISDIDKAVKILTENT